MTPGPLLAGLLAGAGALPPASGGPDTIAKGLEATVARRSRGEVLVDAGSPHGPPGKERKFHGEARLGAGFGFVLEDPVAAISPSVHFDLRNLAPVQFRVGAAFRLRMFDRDPPQSGVLRRRDWDEAGDYVALLQRFEYSDEYPFGRTGRWSLDLRAGELGRVQLGHGSIVRGFHNSLDIDRTRTGLDFVTRVAGRMLGQPAGIEVALIMTDLAASQIIGTRLGLDWAGAGLGFTAVGDPLAPRALARDGVDPDGFVLGRGNSLRPVGTRGVAALGLDLSYRASDDWRYVILPYVDLNVLPGLGQGIHIGIDGEVRLGRRRRVHLGAVGEVTVGSSGYDPAYFDVFYLSQRWQVPFVTRPGDRPTDLGTEAETKYEFVQSESLRGAGGYGGFRFAHTAGAYAETGYHVRPGPLGHTWESRVGLDLRLVELGAIYAHRGRHGFELKAAGSVARLDVRVPVIRYLDVEAGAGWLFAMRPDQSGATMAVGPTALMTGGGFLLVGVAGRVPW